MSHILANKTALVTGGTRGIGRAIANAFSDAGANLIVVGREQPDDLPSNWRFEPTDLLDNDALARLLKKIPGWQIDILVNNAGDNEIYNVVDCPVASFKRQQEFHVNVPFQLCQAALPSMQAKGNGRIINITSIWSVITRQGRAGYTAAKTGLVGFTKTLAAEVAKDGILANCIAPGFIETELFKQTYEQAATTDLLSQVPIGRLGQPQEIAELALWLVSAKNTFLTGQNIVVDGGFTCV